MLITYNTQVDSSRTQLHIKAEHITTSSLPAIKHDKGPGVMIKNACGDLLRIAWHMMKPMSILTQWGLLYSWNNKIHKHNLLECTNVWLPCPFMNTYFLSGYLSLNCPLWIHLITWPFKSFTDFNTIGTQCQAPIGSLSILTLWNSSASVLAGELRKEGLAISTGTPYSITWDRNTLRPLTWRGSKPGLPRLCFDFSHCYVELWD